MENLMIIESPNKVKTIARFLPKNFKIMFTVGHLRDLPSYSLGFDQTTLEPKWTVIKNDKVKDSKTQIIKSIRKEAHDAQHIYLATDPDREGEAISWHIYEILDKQDQTKCERITFNEITQQAVLKAIDNPRKIDLNYVYAQFARRILDRMVGYKLSSLVQRTMKADSAGRVQSLALLFLARREDEIRNFIKTYWWTIDPVIFNNLKLNLVNVNEHVEKTWYEEKNNQIHFLKEEYAKQFQQILKPTFLLSRIDPAKLYFKLSPEPYKTSTLQQDAINTLGWTAKKITNVAQRLYEGIEIKGEHVALISYPRTDSTRYSDTFVSSAKQYINNFFGKEYVSNKTFAQSLKKPTNNVQDAHEAIRVIDVNVTPELLSNVIEEDDYKLYSLIWKHSLATLMTNAQFSKTVIWFENNDNWFTLANHVLVFDGWLKLYGVDQDDSLDMQKFHVQDEIKADEVAINKHESLPPPRYTQASLIADLEKSGVGRPSTFSTMANIPLERGYATLEKKHYYLTALGEEVAINLARYFSNILSVQFTKDMEERLDKITDGKENWKEWLLKFWPELNQHAKDVQTQITADKKEETPDYVGRDCPDDHGKLIYRVARKGHTRFIGCSNYPSCKHVESLKEKPKILEEKCIRCNCSLVERKNKRGQSFIGCSSYPKCNYMRKMNGEEIVLKRPRRLVKSAIKAEAEE